MLFRGCYGFLCILLPLWYSLSLTELQADTNGSSEIQQTCHWQYQGAYKTITAQ